MSDATRPIAAPIPANCMPWPITRLNTPLGLRTESHAKADLLGPLRHGITDDAVQSDHGHQKRQAGENSEQRYYKAARRKRCRNHVGQQLDSGDRQRRIHGAHSVAQAAGETRGIGLRTNHKAGEGEREGLLQHREIISALHYVSGKIGVLGVANHPDNSEPRLVGPVPHMFAHRIFVGPVFAGQGLIDHCYGRCVDAILIGEHAAAFERNFQRGEVVRSNKADIAVRPRIAGRRGASFDGKRSGAGLSAKRHRPPRQSPW